VAKGNCEQEHATHETLELAERESPVHRALHPHGYRSDSVGSRRATCTYDRSLLGGNRDSGRDAIHSGRYAEALHRTHRCQRRLRVSRSSRGKLFRSTNLAAFMLAIFFIGLLSFGFRLEKTAYRYASVILTIIVLIPRTNPAWIVALH